MFDDELAEANEDFFLCFAIQVEIHPYNQPPRLIQGIFDNDFVDIDEGAIIASSTPQITCRAEDVFDLRMDDEVIIKDRAYIVREIQPDSTGLMVFYLYESSTISDTPACDNVVA